jgi:2-oxo-4-hydroxy-4-carboxy--5-ureidoimidazoline (OHCU) decarboxylase
VRKAQDYVPDSGPLKYTTTLGLVFEIKKWITETFYQLTPWHPFIKAASAKRAIAKTYL